MMKKLLALLLVGTLPLFAQTAQETSDVVVSFRPAKYANAVLKQGDVEKKGRCEGIWTEAQIQDGGKKWVLTGADKQNVSVPFEFKTQPFSISFWFQPATLTDGALFFVTTRHPFIGVRMVPNRGKDTFSLHCLMGLTPKGTLARSASDFEINKPYFFTLSLDEKGYYLLAVNGGIELKTTVAGRENPLNSTICFGGPDAWPFHGQFWDVKLHNRALTEEEIGALYEQATQKK